MYLHSNIVLAIVQKQLNSNDLSRDTVNKDIVAFRESALALVRTKHEALPADWLGEDPFSILVQQANALFN